MNFPFTALIHAEPEKKEENIYETVEQVEMQDLNPKKRSDSQSTFQSYDCSSRSSTLSSKPLMGTRVLPPRNNRISDLENSQNSYYSGDDSVSGYESIDGSSLGLNQKKTTMTSFSNPNYLCPDAKTMIERKQAKNKFDEVLESQQNFAANVLNSPAESLISDYHDFQSRLSHDLVDLNQEKCQKPSIKITSFSHQNSVNLRPKTTPVLPRRKPRPVSSGPLELSSMTNPSFQNPTSLSDDEAEKSKQIQNGGGGKNSLSLLMFVLGGRVGQVTVFNGPISLWKLDLNKTF